MSETSESTANESDWKQDRLLRNFLLNYNDDIKDQSQLDFNKLIKQLGLEHRDYKGEDS